MPEKNILWNDYPSKSIAEFTASGRRAVIETSSGPVYSYDADRPKGERFVEEPLGFHSRMWLQAAGHQFHFRPSGEFPFKELEEYLELVTRVQSAIKMFVLSLTPDFPPVERQECARRATDMLADDAVRVLAEPVLINNPFPREFDVTWGPTEGHAGRILKAMIAKWRSNEEASTSDLRTWRCSACGAHGVAEIHPDTPDASLQWMLKDFHSEASPQCEGEAEFDHGSARAVLN